MLWNTCTARGGKPVKQSRRVPLSEQSSGKHKLELACLRLFRASSRDMSEVNLLTCHMIWHIQSHDLVKQGDCHTSNVSVTTTLAGPDQCALVHTSKEAVSVMGDCAIYKVLHGNTPQNRRHLTGSDGRMNSSWMLPCCSDRILRVRLRLSHLLLFPKKVLINSKNSPKRRFYENHRALRQP